MYQTYYPASNASALIWLNNYKTQIAVQGPLLGLIAAQIATQEIGLASDIVEVVFGG